MVVFEAEQEVERIVNPVLLEPLQQFFIVFGVVLDLVHRQQRVLADRFDTNINVKHTGLGRELKQLLIMVGIDRPQAGKADIQGDKCLE